VVKTVNRNTDHKAELLKLIKQAAYSKRIYQVFSDFVEMSAITISNQVDPTHFEVREKRYLELINSYNREHRQLFPRMFFHLVEALEDKAQTLGPEDVLGVIFHELELHSRNRAQFFTPQNISDMMAKMICESKTQSAIEEKGFITMSEPTCGSGVMVTSMCKAMKDEGLNYCSQLVVTAVDCDISCVHMAYVQLALYGVPAVVIHGNSLLCKEWSRWYSPVYLKHGWIWRARCGITDGFCQEDELIKCATEPMYAAFRSILGFPAHSETDTNAEPPSAPEITSVESARKKCGKPKTEQIEKMKQLDLFDEAFG
jgi:hypothetical protein